MDLGVLGVAGSRYEKAIVATDREYRCSTSTCLAYRLDAANRLIKKKRMNIFKIKYLIMRRLK